MKTFTSGTLLGSGAVCMAVGIILRDRIDEINAQMIIALCLMSMGLLVLNFKIGSSKEELQEMIDKDDRHIPVEYQPYDQA